MSWNDFLPELAVKHEVLESLYADIGTPNDEKVKQCQSLFDNLMTVVSQHIETVERERTRRVQECEQMMDDIRRMTGLVGQGEEGITKLAETLHGMALWDRHSLLREEYAYIFEHYNQKLEEIRALHRELSGYATVLGPTYVQPGPYPEEGAAVTFDVIQQFSDNIDACQREQKRRIGVVESAIVTIKHLWNELGLTAQDGFEREIIDSDQGDIPISDDAMRRLEMKQAMLEDERSKRETLVKDHMSTITSLWDKLRIEEDEREEFLTAHVGLTMDVIRGYKAEMSRLEKLKSQKLEDFIMEERDALDELWDKLYYSSDQRQDFSPFFDEDFTDENLALHEAEVARLKQEVQDNEHILHAIEQYRAMLDDIRNFEISSMDAQRLFHRDPGRLLREEKFRNRIAREFPKVESELENALYEWQQNKGRPFLVYGEEYINTMKQHAQEAREGKENERLWREQRKQLMLQRDLRYGSKNPKKVAPQSPHPRHISTSLIPSIDPPATSVSLPQTPTSKRIGIPTSRPGTPSSQHTRTISSFISAMPTTPTRARSQTHQTGLTSAIGSIPFPYSPRSHQAQRHYAQDVKYYSRSESPATMFSLTKPPSTPTSKNNGMRSSGPAAMSTTREQVRRSNSVISVSSATTETQAEPSTPTRPRINHPISFDLTRSSIQEEDEVLLLSPRRLKRTAADLSSPSHTPSGSTRIRRQDHRRKSRSLSPQAEISSAKSRLQTMESPFVLKTADRLGPAQLAAKGAEQGNRFLKQLLRAADEQDDDIDDEMMGIEDDSIEEEDSVIELDRSEAEKIFSTPRRAVEVVEVQDGQDYESDGWETDNDESPRSRKQSKVNAPEASSSALQTQHEASRDSWNSDGEACRIERMPSSSTPSSKQAPGFEIKSGGC
ncbi:microtubule associated protein-domain-containing protein [Gamsiella multidivaricata]|uniref:microtubule associated protein-domain-containing protein n=1 Tax=Gamsiella multidivaricata TaxID=101098 RepID=UPI00221F15E8|nr:microtubule associated protein-domain-containing protein [Gamsiella multidivaricata]KAG0370829.1 hypothetical protein BGZ54_003551 [Gamsiella multidivaricata]KAI7817600.1 microtubule associated protein-domain-containing protein [Gamsiella multidivaricata]